MKEMNYSPKRRSAWHFTFFLINPIRKEETFTDLLTNSSLQKLNHNCYHIPKLGVNDHVEMSRTIMTSIDHHEAVKENKSVPMSRAASSWRDLHCGNSQWMMIGRVQDGLNWTGDRFQAQMLRVQRRWAGLSILLLFEKKTTQDWEDKP